VAFINPQILWARWSFRLKLVFFLRIPELRIEQISLFVLHYILSPSWISILLQILKDDITYFIVISCYLDLILV